MEKEELTTLAQLLAAIKDGLKKLDRAQKNGDNEQVALIKREILSFQKRIEEII